MDMRESMWIPGLVLLVIGATLSFIPFICLFGIPLAIVGLVLLIVGLATSDTPVAPMKTCFSCGQLVAVQYTICPYCGRPTAPGYSTGTPQAVNKEPSVMQSNQKFCPTCGQWYPEAYKLCPRDGSELKAVQ
jgi:RNA polymerase subunit RPABC4/transcription elongation factor Spt4